MPKNILRIIADSPELYEALEFLLYKHAVGSKLDGKVMVDLILQEIGRYKTLTKGDEVSNPAR